MFNITHNKRNTSQNYNKSGTLPGAGGRRKGESLLMGVGFLLG